MTNWHNASTDRLMRVLAGIQSAEDCYRFLEDLCTIKEITDMSQRLDVAVLLNKGTNYQEINKKTGVSTATISRVNKCLSYGSGGYENAISILKSSEEENGNT